MKHETVGAEKLALAWHVFGVAISLWMCNASAGSAYQAARLANAPGWIGEFFLQQCISSTFAAIIAGIGAIWHLWACREHTKIIKELSQ